MPRTRTEVLNEVSVESQGQSRASPPLTYGNTNYASHSVAILSTVRVATHCDWVSYRSIPRALSVYLTFSPVSLLSSIIRKCVKSLTNECDKG